VKVVCLTVALLALSAGPASADEIDVKVAIPTARGRSAWGTKRLTRSLRKTLAKSLSQRLVPMRAFSRALRKVPKKNRRKTEGLAAAGKRAGADYVLAVDITKKGWKYTARARLIRTEDAQVEMDFRSQFFKPKSEAKDRGRRIAARTVRALRERLEQEDGESPGEFPEPAPAEIAEPEPEPEPEPKRAIVRAPERQAQPELKPQPPPEPVRIEEPPPTPPASVTPQPAQTQAQTEPPTTPDSERPFLIAQLTAGSGLLHSYEVSAASVPKSGLSYSLAPVSLVALEAEVLLSSVGIGVLGRASFSPVRFQVNVGDEVSAEPAGSIFDAAGAVRIHFLLGQETPAELVPMLGLRLSSVSVEENVANFVVASQSVIPFLGLALELPLTEALEARLGFEGGFVASFSEEPLGGGELDGGFSLGGNLGLRFWLSEAIGVAVDGRYDQETIDLKGRPERQVPENEDLANASIGTQDLRASIGLALRL
jgi:hypothetical protein